MTLVLNDTTIDLALANRVALARLRFFFARINRVMGPANACYTIASQDGTTRMIRLARWTPSVDGRSAIVTLDVGIEYINRVLLTVAGQGVSVTLPTRAVPAPDSLVQMTGVLSGPPDPSLCLRAAERFYADSGR